MFITVWERFSEKSLMWEHNHISDDYRDDEKEPTPISDVQRKSWPHGWWRKSKAKLIDNKVIREKPMFITHSGKQAKRLFNKCQGIGVNYDFTEETAHKKKQEAQAKALLEKRDDAIRADYKRFVETGKLRRNGRSDVTIKAAAKRKCVDIYNLSYTVIRAAVAGI